MKDLLELRKKIKRKKPNFIRQDAHKKKRLGKKWRKPKGIHSKIRRRLKGHRKRVEIGYCSPSKVKFLDKSGLKNILVKSVNEIKNVGPKDEGVTISGKTGLKKKVEIVKEALKSNIKILNIKKPEEFLKKVEEEMKKRKEKKEKYKAEKEVKKKEAEKRAKEKEEKEKKEKEAEGEKGEGEKKKEEKKEMDKILTTKE